MYQVGKEQCRFSITPSFFITGYIFKFCYHNENVLDLVKIVEADPLENEVRILDWVLYILCSSE
jgi:hypothetical protein